MYQLEMARSGKALFAIRGYYLPLIVVAGVLIAVATRRRGPFDTDAANRGWFWLSLAVALAGALVRIKTSGHAALGTSGNTKKGATAAELNTTGPYSLVRNPLYVGRILNFTGLAMLSGNLLYGVVVFFLSVLVYERISVYEEEYLRQLFGDAHARWAAEVPALVPRLTGWVRPKYPFWVRRAFWRENKKIFMLALAIVLYDLAQHGFDLARVRLSDPVYAVFAVVLAVELVARLLRHGTRTFADLS